MHTAKERKEKEKKKEKKKKKRHLGSSKQPRNLTQYIQLKLNSSQISWEFRLLYEVFSTQHGKIDRVKESFQEGEPVNLISDFLLNSYRLSHFIEIL